jgi:hypothetical protein
MRENVTNRLASRGIQVEKGGMGYIGKMENKSGTQYLEKGLGRKLDEARGIIKA